MRAGCYRIQLQTPGQARTWPSLRLAPDESLSRLGGQGLRLRQQATRRRRALARDLARLQDRAPEGWPRLQPRAALLTLRRSARAADRRGGECAPAPTWPEGPKEGSRRPGASRSPPVASQSWAEAAPLDSRRRRRAALSHGRRPAPARRAERALEVVCRASPHRVGARIHVGTSADRQVTAKLLATQVMSG